MQLVFFSMEAAGIAILLALWAATVVRTALDAGRRCSRASLRLGWTLVAILLPFVGAAVYALAKPCEERADVRARRLRVRLFEAVLAGDEERCRACAAPLQPEFRCCPSCGEQVRTACGGCGRPVRTGWAACPWCTKPLVERDEAAALSEVA